MTDVPDTLQTVLDAAVFAANAHKNQRRKDADGTPYINHPLRVCQTLTHADIVDPEILAAALLHDVVEDCGVTRDQLTQHFGTEVATLVMSCTDNKFLPVVERKMLQIQHMSEISYGAQLIKLADKIDNCRDLLANAPRAWSVQRIQGYFVWSQVVVNEAARKWPRYGNYNLDIHGRVDELEYNSRHYKINHLIKQFDNIVSGTFTTDDGFRYPCIPDDPVSCLLEFYEILRDAEEAKKR